jgi:hypothetical protein
MARCFAAVSCGTRRPSVIGVAQQESSRVIPKLPFSLHNFVVAGETDARSEIRKSAGSALHAISKPGT